jgi:hypothetical protein
MGEGQLCVVERFGLAQVEEPFPVDLPVLDLDDVEGGDGIERHLVERGRVVARDRDRRDALLAVLRELCVENGGADRS